ncbi:type VII secretion system-associated protein [Streptomyces coelicoflavus]|uniref:type VII secretion system-associated protein n=1 Tax=Streptomyces coelicoflavus TaxID=285562 RepID=UPI0037F9F93C
MTSPASKPDREGEGVAEPAPQRAPETAPTDQVVPRWLPPVRRGEPGFREPPERYASAAKAAPDHWFTLVDRHWHVTGDEPVPHWAVLGRWRSDDDGQIFEWEENFGYRPSPDAHGWGPPDSPADTAARLAATGYGERTHLLFALLEEDMAVCVHGEGELDVVELPDGTRAVPVFPIPSPDEVEVPAHEVMSVTGLLERLSDGEEILFLSCSAPVSLLVLAAELRAAQEVAARHGTAERADRSAGLPGTPARGPGSATSR